jgi:hypothetical protein
MFMMHHAMHQMRHYIDKKNKKNPGNLGDPPL